MPEFTIEIASLSDREELIAELWFGADQVAELSRDNGSLTLQLYGPPSNWWEFPFEDFTVALNVMRLRLLSYARLPTDGGIEGWRSVVASSRGAFVCRPFPHAPRTGRETVIRS